MMYYLIDPQTSTIISGPFLPGSPELKKITRCGTPELLNLVDFNIVPEVKPVLTSTQKYGTPLVTPTEVTYEILEKTKEELAEEEQFNAEFHRDSLACTPRQLRILLTQQKLLATVESYISSMDDITKIEWEYAQEIKRTHPAITSLSKLLYLSETQTDELFELARNI